MYGFWECYKTGIRALTIQPNFLDEIKEAGQYGDVKLERVKAKLNEGKVERYEIHEDGSIRYKGRWGVPRYVRS